MFGVVLFVTGLLMAVYSPWLQEAVRTHLVAKMNAEPDTEFRLGSLKLGFPLRLTVDDVLLVSHGDTLLAASSVKGNVALSGLLKGNVNVTDALVTDARYQIGALDSATCVVIKARRARLDPTKVQFSPLNIDVSSASLDGGSMSLFINPVDTFPVTAESTEPTDMKIRVGRLDYNDLTFTMNLMPVIDTLSTRVASGYLSDIRVDLLKQTVDVGEFIGSGLDARYIMPDSAQIAATRVISVDTVASEPWTVRVSRIDIDKSRALYTTNGYKPVPGLDFEYIEADSVHLVVNDFYNRADVVSVPLALSGRERSGLDVDITGTLGVDSLGVTLRDFAVRSANNSDVRVSGYIDLTTQSYNVDGKLAMADAVLAFPDIAMINRGLRPGAMADIDAVVNGTETDFDIKKLDLALDGYMTLSATGRLNNVYTPADMNGSLRFNGTVGDISSLLNAFMADAGFVVPSMTFDGHATFGGGDYDGALTAVTHGGRVALDGSFKGRGEVYRADVAARDFPVSAFLPTAGVGRVTGTIRADGHGFDVFSRATGADVSIDIKKAEYDHHTYHDIRLDAGLADGHGTIDLETHDTALPVKLKASGNLDGDKYNWTADLNTGSLDLTALGLADAVDNEPVTVSTSLSLDAGVTRDMREISATLQLNSLNYDAGPASSINLTDVHAVFNTTDSTTNLMVGNGDMTGTYSSPMSLDSVMGRIDRLTTLLEHDIKAFDVNIERIQRVLMPFELSIDAGSDNIVNDILSADDISFGHMTLMAANDTSIYMKGRVTKFHSGTVNLDTIDIDVRQLGKRLNYALTVNNRPGTFDEWAHVVLDGYVDTAMVNVNLIQHNIKGETGFRLGAAVTVGRDSVVTLRFQPYNPVINYHEWSVNNDNFITFDMRNHHLDANLRMKDDISRLALYTEHVNSTDAHDHDEHEDLILQVMDIQLQDWLALNPFAPVIKGNLSAGLRVNYIDNQLNGSGTVSLTDLKYGKEKVGDFQADIKLLTDVRGLIRLNTDLWVDGQRTITLSGALNDSTRTSPFNLDLRMIHFPLRTVNPFLTGTATLDGVLDGTMDVSGDSERPVLNGHLAFNNATVLVDMLGTKFTLSNDSIPVRDNIVTIDGFSITGCNENPLTIKGRVDISDMASPDISLTAKATNMQIVKSNRPPRGADVYGKAFISLNSNVRGNFEYMSVDATLDLLPGTNVYYVMANAATTFEDRTSEGMVKFVNFNDSLAMAAADSIAPPSSIIDINATLNVQTGTVINVDLSTSGQDRVQLQGNGSLNYTSSILGDGRLSGRYNITGGYFRYSPPLISNLDFNFNPNSYVAFTGDMMNPQLNVHATERMRANVSQTGQNSRLIYFDIGLNVTGTLNDMNVAFDLSTDDDITVANELATMSPTQRASEAMNLLLYNTYTGGSTKATSNLNGNPLYSFLTSQLNSWAAQNIKAVDISFGVDQYDKTMNGNTSTATSYSYQVSKSLFDDRFKIVVGGSYSTDANANESLAESLINDVSFEYFLNNARTMYVRLFRHTGYESILEGEITQTGVGFIYKKKISRVSDMFDLRRRRKKDIEQKDTPPADNEQPTNSQPESETETDETLPQYL